MRRLLIAFVVVGLLAACGGQSTPPPTALNAPPGATAARRTSYLASDPALVRGTGRAQVIEFYSAKSDQSMALMPIIHQLEDQYTKSVDFVYLDVDQDNTKQLQKDFNTTSALPVLVFLSADGVEENRLVGVHTKQEIDPQIEALLAVG
jgi:thiol-disulfide isomerase/thioredoxin